ncbi:stealth family protein [Paractinoplanes rishiriensis]|uniref:Exopolysaccharide phosphotransferase n=1 Tax=Paractinoplanes rishiriensis TaxID=1050105 RepID=A0A919K9L6_9ACTN|nr:stealth family protein [Actinoplanes rishiriensis]GIE99131.1 exopolysaccharide phosphotransferase [Actinoplanes rishiriensis]
MSPLRLVRKAVPRPVRRLVFTALPAPVRDALAKRKERRDPLVQERNVAGIDPDASPLSVRTRNLDRVVDALDEAGVGYFRVPPVQWQRTALAVPESARPGVERVLARLARAGATVAPVVDDKAGLPVATAVYWPITDPGRHLLLGVEHACEIEFWREEADRLVAPRFNLSVDVVLHTDAEVEADESAFGDFRAAAPGRTYRTRQPFLLPALEHVDFPIDVVYTWVDGADPAWVARKNAALVENGWVSVNEEAANASRYVSRDELRYSLRSLHAYAPWVRRIFLVTDDQVPEWLNVDHPQVTVVSHKEIFGTEGRLPTFNSMAIETRLHHIEGLSEHFLYVNDDVFFGQALPPGFFFTASGQTRVFLSRIRVDCGPPTADEPPVMSAGKNNRALIEREFGRFLGFKIKHTPHAARRSVLAEIVERYPEQIAATAAHQFRHPEDISLTSSLQQHWSYLTGRAVLGDVQYMYRDLADPLTPQRLATTLRRRHHQLFCLNDTNSTGAEAQAQAAMLASFLPAYYPFRSPYELSGGV